MHGTIRRRTAMLLLLVVPGIMPAHAVEVPLSRASFERALHEGGACERFDAQWNHVVFHKNAEPAVASLLEDLVQEALQQEFTETFVTVRLMTPYTRARMAACEAKQFGRPLDAQALWEAVRTVTTISLFVEMSTLLNTYDSEPLDGQARYPDTERVPGPQMKSVAIQRGQDRETRVEPHSIIGGAEYLFPAAALQGQGPFYVLIRTDQSEHSLKLKRSALGQP